MSNPVDHSEWIDRYLRGELRGEELELFERRLKQDPQFALEFKSQKLLADAIRLARKEELKRFIAARTRHRIITLPRNRTFLIGMAASVAIFAAGWLGWKMVLPTVQKKQVAAAPNADKEAPLVNTPANKEAGDHSLAYEPVRPNIEALPAPEESVELDANYNRSADMAEPSMQENAPATAEQEPTTELVASIQVALAEWEPARAESDDALNEEIKAVTVTASRNKLQKPAVSRTDKATEDVPAAAGAEPKSKPAQQPIYDLVFLNTADAATAFEMKSGRLIYLYNLSYLNPLMMHYQNRHFLKTAGIWYELNLQASGKQNLSPLKDKALLDKFGKE